MSEELIKKSEYSGLFYSSDPAELRRQIDIDISKVATLGPDYSELALPALIAPSAGYSYGAMTALSAYQKLLARHYRKVIVLGSSQFFRFDGIALPAFRAYETPLGQIMIDELSVERLRTNFNFHVYENAFTKEYSVELQLPYLQYCLKDFELVPLMVGNKVNLTETANKLAEIVDDFTLVVVSTNFSHFHNEELAKAADTATINALQSKNSAVLIRDGQASALHALSLLNELAIQKHWLPVLMNYNTSSAGGDDTDSVVGYASLIYLQE